MSLETRLQKLENAQGIGQRVMAVIITREGESMEEAIARHHAQYGKADIEVQMDFQLPSARTRFQEW